MNIASKLLTASLLALSFAAPALAQTSSSPESLTLEERNVYLFMNGKMIRMKAGDTTHAMIMREFKPLKATMIYVSGGKFYAAEDAKMASGKMLSTEIYGKDFGAGVNQ